MPQCFCPVCGSDYELPVKEAGRKARCADCQTKFIVAFEFPNAAQTIVLPIEDSSGFRLASPVSPPARRPGARTARTTQLPNPVAYIPQSQTTPTLPPSRSNSTTQKKTHYSRWPILAAILLVSTPAYSWFRNIGLREKLRSCPTFEAVEADVYYRGVFSGEVVVFNFVDGKSSSTRRIDPVHLLLEFAGKLDLSSVRRVVLARGGRDIFYVSSKELRPLADSYAGGGRVWSFNHLPESVRTMSGRPAFEEWTGGWLGVLQKQAEDNNKFIRDWTGY